MLQYEWQNMVYRCIPIVNSRKPIMWKRFCSIFSDFSKGIFAISVNTRKCTVHVMRDGGTNLSRRDFCAHARVCHRPYDRSCLEWQRLYINFRAPGRKLHNTSIQTLVKSSFGLCPYYIHLRIKEEIWTQKYYEFNNIFY